PMLFCEALADLFDYTVKYIQVKDNLSDTAPRVPSKDYVADTNGEGTKGTITYINTAVGGWNSAKALNNIQRYVLDYIEDYGCDLFVVALGMNDRYNSGDTTLIGNLESITDRVLQAAPKTGVVLVSTMVCNPHSTNYLANEKADQREGIKGLAEEFRAEGVACGVCDMGSVSLSILERKEFHDCSGNNINHPNDFFGRVYAQTLLQTVIGYENMG
ncbi:MAG: SGNH/GDSL hydrolase family protein, partial [Clostridia bacterium]|nr:SGNH/GDSL hydrolase family protein [Clostridia bacterium]